MIPANDSRASKENEVARIERLTSFIDLFNYYPIKVQKLRYKNDSNELTYVMNGGIHGSQNERGETILPKAMPKTVKDKDFAELLQLVSDKIKERFSSFQHFFRVIDTDHSQSISINEFCQAVEFMRLKISFDDVKKLFQYMDKNNNGIRGNKHKP